jgi:hypothetical protein
MKKVAERLDLIKRFMADNDMSHREIETLVTVIGFECDANDIVNKVPGAEMGLFPSRRRSMVLNIQHDSDHEGTQ